MSDSEAVETKKRGRPVGGDKVNLTTIQLKKNL